MNPAVCSPGYVGLVHTTPEKILKCSFIIFTVTWNLPCLLISHENRAFWKRPLNRRNLNTPASRFRFRVDGKQFENGAFWERWHHGNHVISLTQFPSNRKPRTLGIAAFLNSSRVVWTENSISNSSIDQSRNPPFSKFEFAIELICNFLRAV